MPASQEHITPQTPLGANLIADGATFSLWAPSAKAVFIARNADSSYTPADQDLLIQQPNGRWTGFVPGVADGTEYRFWVVGKGSTGFKRDPYARELVLNGYPDCNCIVRDPNLYPWHDAGFRPPAFSDLTVYQLHVGTFYGVDAQGHDNRSQRVAKFLDVIQKIEYFVDLGVNAIEPLPITEFQGATSLGYNGTDLFSPEMDYAVAPADLPPYVDQVNALLAQRLGAGNFVPLTVDHLQGQVNQAKAMVDLCHVFGLAVIFDVVYNHAGGFDNQDQSIYFLDRDMPGDNNRSLYFTDQGWAGGLVFAFWKSEVCQFLIDNANFFLQEYHVDGLRYDEVTVIDSFGGWHFCQDLTNSVRTTKPVDIQIAEYWKNDQSWVVKSPDDGGAGFDTVWAAGLRTTIRQVISQATSGANASISWDPVAAALYRGNLPAVWRRVQYVESHDEVYLGHSGVRIVALADSSNARSWYARSRARVATGLVLTGTGIPMLFMGQEFLEDKPWSDNPEFYRNTLIWWDGLQSDKAMQDHLRFTRELLGVRRQYPALRGEGLNVFHVHNDNRILAFHRWVEGVGGDVVVVTSLRESTFYNHSYQIGFPLPGQWNEVFNSDIYDNFFNPQAQGNPGGITANGPPMHGLSFSAGITIPANAILVFAHG